MLLYFNSKEEMWDFIDTYIKSNYSANNFTFTVEVYSNKEEIKKLYDEHVNKK